MVEKNASPGSPETLLSSLEETIQALMQKTQVPGVVVGIFTQGQEHTIGLGLTSIENPLEVDAETLFQVGSTTKVITATAALRLVERGKLELDQPVRHYLPDLHLGSSEVTTHVTLRHLLTHTGGWEGDYFEDLGPGNDALAAYVANLTSLRQITPLGAAWSYNNTGFSITGRLIEVVTGKPYESAIKELVFDPLGMHHTFFFAHDAITYRVAVGHVFSANGRFVARPWALPRTVWPAGGVVAPVRDLLRFVRFHLREGTTEDGTRLLSKELLAHMQSEQIPTGGARESIGLAWFLKQVDGVRLVNHQGETLGQAAALLLVPEHDFALIILTNAQSGTLLIEAVTKWVLEHYFGAKESEPIPQERTDEEIAPYLGVYASTLGDFDVSLQNGQLMVQYLPKIGFPTKDDPPPPPPPPLPVAFSDRDRLVVLASPLKGATADFLRKPDGSIGWFRVMRRVAARQEHT